MSAEGLVDFLHYSIYLPSATEKPASKPVPETLPSLVNITYKVLDVDLNFIGACIPQYVPSKAALSSCPS